MNKSKSGFTIVELLIVIVVIAILAAIAFFAFNGVQRRATESSLKSDLASAMRQLELLRTTDGTYPADTTSIKKSSSTTFQYTTTGSTFCISATSGQSAFYVANGGSVQAGVCAGHTAPTAGGGGGSGSPVPTLISSGNNHTCAVSNNKAYCWGNDNFGQAGNGGPGSGSTPVAVVTTTMTGNVTAISSGSYYSCAVADAKAYCWGNNNSGQLGNGNTSQQLAPVAVTTSLMTGSVTGISASYSAACAIADGKAYCWGANSTGQLGNGTTTSSNVPVAVNTSVMTGTVTSISTSEYGQTCAVADSKAYCWGANSSGMLGNGTTTNSNVPVAVSTSVMSGSVSMVNAEGPHSCAVADAKAYCWGGGFNGRLGNGSSSNSSSPVAVTATLMSGSVSYIDTSTTGTCAVANSRAYCWGGGSNGRLGNGGTSDSNVPVAVSTSLMSGNVSAVTTQDYFSCALSSGGTYCWGTNSNYELGNGTTTQQTSPAAVSAFP